MTDKTDSFLNDNPPQVDDIWLNMTQQERNNFILAGSITPADATNDQMAKSITNSTCNSDYFVESGIADAYVVSSISPNKNPSIYRTGMRVRFRTTNANTGASTINVATLGNKNIKLQDGTTDPVAGDISSARENTLVYDGSVFRITTQFNDASTSVKGIVELATQTEVDAGTDPNRVITPSTLRNFVLFQEFSITSPVSSFEIKDLDSSKTYDIDIRGIKVNTANANLLYQSSINNGASYFTTAYYGTGYSNGSTGGGAIAGIGQNNTSSIIVNSITTGIQSYLINSGSMYCCNMRLFASNIGQNHFALIYSCNSPSTNREGGTAQGGCSITNVNAIKFTISSGTIDDGDVKVYERY